MISNISLSSLDGLYDNAEQRFDTWMTSIPEERKNQLQNEVTFKDNELVVILQGQYISIPLPAITGQMLHIQRVNISLLAEFIEGSNSGFPVVGGKLFQSFLVQVLGIEEGKEYKLIPHKDLGFNSIIIKDRAILIQDIFHDTRGGSSGRVRDILKAS
ncbi:hypothetical protein LAT59_01455 [Candidatus Gracilibacteria bacterium]|nr:hypothetical protein [Candidatus Gracilibacteria bacterium]